MCFWGPCIVPCHNSHQHKQVFKDCVLKQVFKDCVLIIFEFLHVKHQVYKRNNRKSYQIFFLTMKATILDTWYRFNLSFFGIVANKSFSSIAFRLLSRWLRWPFTSWDSSEEIDSPMTSWSQPRWRTTDTNELAPTTTSHDLSVWRHTTDNFVIFLLAYPSMTSQNKPSIGSLKLTYRTENSIRSLVLWRHWWMSFKVLPSLTSHN